MKKPIFIAIALDRALFGNNSHLKEEKIVQFSFRPKVPDKDCIIEFVSKGKVFDKRKSKHIIPSEMLNYKIKMNPEMVDTDITIHIKKLPPKPQKEEND